METILGLVMIYTWVHLIVLIFQHLYKKLSSYEKVVTITAMVSFVLYILGTVNN